MSWPYFILLAYVVTEKIEGIAGMPNVRDHDSSIYFKLQGDALSFGGYENDPIFIDQVRICVKNLQYIHDLTKLSFLIRYQKMTCLVFTSWTGMYLVFISIAL